MRFPAMSNVVARCSLGLVVAVLMSACGGVDSGGTGGSAVIGPINGLGSIIVNGVRFDETAALITDDDGLPMGRERLKLGVFTSVEGSGITTIGAERIAKASRITVSSDLIGDVQAIDQGAKTIVLLGQAVKVTAATVFEDQLAQGLDSLSVGMPLEIFARFDAASGTFAATRIEQRPQPTFKQVRARIDSLDAAARTIRIGALLVDYSQIPASDLPILVTGNIVRVRLQAGALPGSWKAVSAMPGVRPLADGEASSIEGRISSFDSLARFSVDGVTVDASGAVFPSGTTGLGLGARVEVEGNSRSGVLYAKEVRLEGDEDSSNSIFELHGQVESIDTSGKVLVVRGISVDLSGGVVFVGGVAGDLAVGRQIEVKGVLRGVGVGLVAQVITFELN